MPNECLSAEMARHTRRWDAAHARSVGEKGTEAEDTQPVSNVALSLLSHVWDTSDSDIDATGTTRPKLNNLFILASLLSLLLVLLWI